MAHTCVAACCIRMQAANMSRAGLSTRRLATCDLTSSSAVLVLALLSIRVSRAAEKGAVLRSERHRKADRAGDVMAHEAGELI